MKVHNINFLAAFLTQTVCFDDTTVKFEIWDTAGQENILFISCILVDQDLLLKFIMCLVCMYPGRQAGREVDKRKIDS